MKEYVKRKIKNKKIIISIILMVLSLIITTTYAYFVITTSEYKSSELLVAELDYGINIEEDEPKSSIINGKRITISPNTKSYYTITISNINKIDTKYTLTYKSDKEVLVEYTDKTEYTSEGYINGYDENVYTKRIRIVIDNTTSEEVNIEIKAYGGYTYNTYTSINIGEYKTIKGPYKEGTSISWKQLNKFNKKRYRMHK